ncbi:autotransporter outer membrane beta-barrel domain-containing protein [Caballeronia sp. INDeC2]|uniref:autotransporter outer membrane beta-barrel domain-containing protein n=1 Tax=Caballeronia sp. INDeC2 TaxID=2921747 RepID=UPI002028F798|nr:autotransporter outer membrane beta-barrel domain-containing protein [Caballeronia sp. INDeC2]
MKDLSAWRLVVPPPERSLILLPRAGCFGLVAAMTVSVHAQQIVCPPSCSPPPNSSYAATAVAPVAVAVSGSPLAGSQIGISLLAAGTTGVFEQSNATVTLTGATITANLSGAAANNLYGIRASSASLVAGNARISLRGTGIQAHDLVGVAAESNAQIEFTDSTVQTDGTTSFATSKSYGLLARGAGNQILFHGGTVTTLTSRGSHAVYAVGGGHVLLDRGTVVHTTGAQIVSPVTGSHGLLASGAGSLIEGDGIAVSASGNASAAAQAEQGGSLSLTSTSLVSTGADVGGASAGLRVLSGASASVSGSGSSMSTSGRSAPAVAVDGAGSHVQIADATLSTTGLRAYGLAATNGGLADLAGSDISITPPAPTSAAVNNAFGLYAAGANSRINAHDVAITMGADNRGHGVQALDGGTVTLDQDTTILTQGQSSVGLWARNGSITADGVAVTTTGAGGSIGMLADQANGVLTALGGSVETKGSETAGPERAHGLAARLGGTLSATDTSVHTRGTNAMGVLADDGGTVRLANNAITTDNTGAIGLYSIVEPTGPAANATITGSGVSVNTSGDFAHGAAARQKFLPEMSRITISGSSVVTRGNSAVGLLAIEGAAVRADSGSTITTSGADSQGLMAVAQPSAVTVDTTVVKTSGSAAHGAVAAEGGSVTVNAARLEATGPQAMALYATSSVSAPSAAQVTGGTLLSQSGPVIGASGLANISLTRSVVGAAGSTRDWLRVGASSDFPPLLPLTLPEVDAQPAADSPLEPASSLSAVLTQRAALPAATSSTAALNISGSTMTGSATTLPGSISMVTMQSGSLWNLTGNSNLTQLTSSGSEIAFSEPAGNAFKTLTVVNYAGQPGSLIGLNTYLGGDGSPSDKVVIDGGTASGQSGLRIRNTLAPNNIGPGALTTANGILVVDAIGGASTAPTAFTLNGRVTAGAYEYRLFRGSVDASNPQAWYLRSAQPPEPPTPVPPTPPNPPTPTPPVPPKPLFRPEVAAYLANRRIIGDFLVHSLHDRLGEPQWTDQQTFDNDDAQRNSLWLRFVGKDFASRSEDGNFDANSQAWLLQGGGDVAIWSVFRGDDRLHLGGMFGYGWGDSTGHATGNPYSADSDTHGVNVGVYATWFQNDERRLGWYGDFWAQYGWYSNSVNGQLLPSVSYNTQAMAVSAEGGYAWYPWIQRNFAIEPQAQVIYAHGTGSDVEEPGGTRVDTSGASGWITRLGVRFHGTFDHASGKRSQPYLTLNWWHDSVSNGVAFNQYGVSNLYPSNRYEVKLGLNLLGRAGWTGWGNVGWQVGSQSFHAFIGRVGIKRTW